MICAEIGDYLPSLEAHMPVLEGDFSLNAANVLSADLLLGQGLARLTPTHDLNAAQMAALARNLGPERWFLGLIPWFLGGMS